MWESYLTINVSISFETLNLSVSISAAKVITGFNLFTEASNLKNGGVSQKIESYDYFCCTCRDRDLGSFKIYTYINRRV